jgi:hypothetical protein
MRYRFNFMFQLIYGIVTFISCFAVLYLITKEVNWISPSILGITNFIISGFFNFKNEKCKK